MRHTQRHFCQDIPIAQSLVVEVFHPQFYPGWNLQPSIYKITSFLPQTIQSLLLLTNSVLCLVIQIVCLRSYFL